MSAKAHLEGLFDGFEQKPLEFNNSDSRVLPDFYKNFPMFDMSKITFNTPLPHQSSPFPIHTMAEQTTPDFLLQAYYACTSD